MAAVENCNRHPVAESETTNENRKPTVNPLKIASVTAGHNMTCSNTIQGQQKIDPGAFQEAPELFCMSQLLNTTQTECVSWKEEHGHEVHGFGNFHELLLKTTVDSGKPKYMN